MSRVPFQFSPSDLREVTADAVFENLIRQSTGGVTVRSCAAPALATQFVKSSAPQKAAPGVEGAFAELIYPSNDDVARRLRVRHGDEKLFGYISTARSDAFPAGYGERAARALAREESSYQLKGVFPSAAMSYAKLRARMEAREGDTEALDTIFSTMWGLPEDGTKMIPRLHIVGSEATRVSALEDRAYHSLSAHPCANGGFRVDTATLAPDALGPRVPLNWPRLRIALKAIAHVQIYGDLSLSSQIHKLNSAMDFRFRMDMTFGAQPPYIRSANWETIVEQIILGKTADMRLLAKRESEPGYQVYSQMSDASTARLLLDDDIFVSENVLAIARAVSETSNRALLKTAEVMIAADQARAEAEALEEEELQEFEASQLSDVVDVPRYKVVRTSLYKGLHDEFSSRSTIPDMVSHGKARKLLDLDEFRESNIAMPVDVPSALHLAVYMTVQKPRVQRFAYELMLRLTAEEKKLFPRCAIDSEAEAQPVEKAAVRLRKQALYASETIRNLGEHLFGLEFNNIFEMLLRNMADQRSISDVDVKETLWSYLCNRSRTTKKASVPGDWRDLMEYLWHAPEGWTLYYWVRMTIGKIHHTSSSGILAPISAGTEVDALTMVKAGIRDRIRRWADIYTGKYRQIEGSITASRESRKGLEEAAAAERAKSKADAGADDRDVAARYIPPHARTVVDIEQRYSAEEILSRSKSFEAEEYTKMVSAQTKAKFFSSIDVFSRDRKILVGISDTKMREMLVEFYQARWYSLEVRINKAASQKKVFKLGQHSFSKHPWGPLRTELPETISGMLAFMSSLDQRAWTLPPDHVYNQLEKAIGELWADIHAEVNTLSAYAMDVHEGIVEQQDERALLSSAQGVVQSTMGAPAIPIPTFGYRSPNMMPSRGIQIETRDTDQHTGQPGSKTIVTAIDDDEEDEELQDYEGEMITYFVNTSDVAQKQDARGYVSLRTIWHCLDLPEKNDDLMKFALACGASTDLDAPHVDSNHGPLVYVGEETKVMTMWRVQRSAIMHRLTGKIAAEMGADM